MKQLNLSLWGCLATLCLLLTSQALSAQTVIINPDTFCISLDDVGPGFTVLGNVMDNDFFEIMDDSARIVAETNSTCFRLADNGEVSIIGDLLGPDCCGEYDFPYFYQNHEGCLNMDCVGFVHLKILCPKPSCDFVDLTSLGGDGSSPGGDQTRACIQACENSTATYYTSYQPGFLYEWSATNGTVNFDPAPPAEVQVNWGPLGESSLELYVTDLSGHVDTTYFCVELTPAPVPDFDFTAGACRDEPVCFENLSTGAATYLWDFGDGNYSTAAEPCHPYAVGGTYTITLYATSAGGTDAAGNELCCCTDSISMEVEIDPLPGPGIYWVSTLCEGDESVYWTDAENCDTLLWTVTDADGNSLPFSFPGAEQDSILVNWGSGPFGTINLIASGCDEDYCPNGSTVTIPIISSNGEISGPDEVCLGQTFTYELPKWNSVSYDWQITGGTINGDPSMHSVSVTWDVLGMGNLSVTYGSEFLAGLPGHEGDDCFGSASLDVLVRGNFELMEFQNGLGCITGSSFITTVSDFPGASFNWSVSPGPVSFSTFGGGASISIDWSSSPGPGTYTVTAIPNSPVAADYCISERTITIEVIEIDPPLGILGPEEYCVGDTLSYSIDGGDPSAFYGWSVVGGTILSGFGSPSVVVNWTSAGGTTISATSSINSPVFCQSDPVSLSISEKVLLPVTGLDVTTACINSLQSYTALPPQHPDAVFNWSLSPAGVGSIVGGQGSPTVDIQWNESAGSATLDLVVELCGNTETFTQVFSLFVPTQPVITQDGILCPGVTARLEVDSTLFSSISWSTGATTGGISINSGGAYVVNTVDLNGCVGVDSYVPVLLPGPDDRLSLAGPAVYCVPDNGGVSTGNSVDVLAAFDPDYSYQWFCNGVLQAETSAVFTHDITGVDSVFTYYAIITDTNTGCQTTTQTRFVRQQYCTGGGPGCNNDFIDFAVTATNQTPRCDRVDLMGVVSAPLIDIEWSWPSGIGISVVAGSAADPNLSLEFPDADCYVLRARHIGVDPVSGDTCFADSLVTVCVPLVADFSFTDSCGRVSFTDQSTTLLPSVISSWAWDFGDGGSSTSPNPVHDFSGSGPFTVTLTVTDGQGCESVHTETISPGPGLDPQIILPPAPFCVDEAIQFMGLAPGAILYEWDFGDGALFTGQNPIHAYTSAASYTVSLTVTDAFGCQQKVDSLIAVSDNPNPVTISVAPDNIVCAGETITLSVPAQVGITYLWSNGDTGNSTSITVGGSYTVSLFTADSCIFVADSVDLTFLPGPPATISGSPFLCDGEPVTLSGPSGPFSYFWINALGDTVSFGSSITLGPGDIATAPFSLIVRDNNGCTSFSDPVDLVAAVAPTPAITLSSGSGCEGEPNVLEVVSPVADLIYSWSNGDSGTSTTVVAAGTYVLIALDPTTGCTGRTEWTINPLPDICIVPVGCYESCNPDTLCGPLGDNLSYQWYQDGAILVDETDVCLIATASGSYSLHVTNEFGCTSVSDSLILDLIDCDSDCEDIVTRISPITEDSCCYAFGYLGLPDGILGVEISTDDATIVVDPASVGADYNLFMPDPGTFQLGSSSPGGFIPSTSAGIAAEFCLEDAIVYPQTVYVSYLDEEQMVVCRDTFELTCPVEPPCIYVAEDTISCGPEGEYVFTATICRPADADFDVSYIQFMAESPAADADPGFPVGINLSPPLTAAMPCTTLTFTLNTTAAPDEEFCYSLVAHSADPEDDPTALCCSSEEVYCLILPDCDPCDDLGVLSVDPIGDEEECCYVVTLFNEVSDPLLDGIQLCALDTSAELSAFTALGGDWLNVAGTAKHTVDLLHLDGQLPLGDFSLPELCIGNVSEPVTEIEIKWMSGDSIVCRDTVQFECEPDCGYLTFDEFGCEDGFYFWGGELHNTSVYSIDEAHFAFDPTTGLSPYDTTIEFISAIPPGGSIPIELLIGAPAAPGDSICVQVYLHEENQNEDHIYCCDFKTVIVMPDCDIEECLCGNEFVQQVALGFNIDLDPSTNIVSLNPAGEFLACDEIFWELRINNGPREVIGTGYDFSYGLPGSGAYQICMNVIRMDDNGETCSRRRCRNIIINAAPVIFPNPADLEVVVEIPDDRIRYPFKNNEAWQFDLLDLHGRLVGSWQQDALESRETGQFRIPIADLAAGVYLFRSTRGEDQWTERLVISR
ncbi:MAG: PKD domain-containing protein [Bacteroidota bacterium]